MHTFVKPLQPSKVDFSLRLASTRLFILLEERAAQVL